MGNIGSMGVRSAPAVEKYRTGATLSVSDIVKLATAGIAITFDDIAYCVRPDDQFTPNRPYEVPPIRTLEDAFWDRWNRSNRADERELNQGKMYLRVAAHEYGKTVYLFVMPVGAEPFILEDTSQLFPSDALMAALYLREKAK